MALRVRFQGGDRAGEWLEFGEDVEWIRFGRDASTCDVVFPENETRVSREHFALRRVLGSYRLTTNQRSDVLVEGARGHDDQVLEGQVELQVGERGPKVIVETIGASQLAVTAGKPARRPGTHTRLELVTRSLRANRLASGLALALLIVSAGAAWMGFVLLRGRLGRVEARTSEVLEISRGEMAALSGSLAELEASKASFRELFARVEPSLYLILVRSRAGTDRPCGTAWSVGEGLLATNAHVALVLDGLPGCELVARSAVSPHHDLRIDGVRVHPGYQSFARILSDYRPIDPTHGGAELDLVAACDVALLETHTDDRSKQTPPLDLAAADELRALAAGDVLVSLGFPSENLVRGGFDPEHPRAAFQPGHVVGLSDFFLDRTEDAELALLVQHNMPVAGGSSGGPILDEHGRVVAINCAGNFADVSGVRVPIGGINFGQRADLLQELLDGKVDETQAARESAWQKCCERLAMSGEDWVFREIVSSTEHQLLEGGMQTSGFREVVAESTSIGERSRPQGAAFRIRFADTGLYLFVAVPSPPIDLDLEASMAVASTVEANEERRVVGRDDASDAFPAVLLSIEAGEELEVAVYATQAIASDVRVKLKVFQAMR